jgi:EAL domain-containing protein (putative c-di-GMP-specific phosphodiesterase class I)
MPSPTASTADLALPMHFIRHSRSSNVCLQPLRYPQFPFINPLLRFTLETALQYQPKFTAPDGPVIGVEALVRWAHPTRGMIAPDQFIPLAEKTGLIVPIGEWVLDEACRQISEWREAGRRDWTMAVNLSALQFRHAGLIQTVREALKRHALEPGCLTLEVTESTAIRNADASLRSLQQLSRHGRDNFNRRFWYGVFEPPLSQAATGQRTENRPRVYP